VAGGDFGCLLHNRHGGYVFYCKWTERVMHGKASLTVMYGTQVVLIWEGVQKQLDELYAYGPLAVVYFAKCCGLSGPEEALAALIIQRNLISRDPSHLADIVTMYWLLSQRNSEGQILRERFMGRQWKVTFLDQKILTYKIENSLNEKAPVNFQPMTIRLQNEPFRIRA
jgi:hypothetical protein